VKRSALHLAQVQRESSCGLCPGTGIIPGVDEVILRTIVIQFDGRVVEVFGHSAEATRGHVALMREPKIGKPDYRGRSEIVVYGCCRFGVDADELPKLVPLLGKIAAAVRAAQSSQDVEEDISCRPHQRDIS
jgi:hypothetical protein